MPQVLRFAVVAEAMAALAVGGVVPPAAAQTDELSVASFNIPFLGRSRANAFVAADPHRLVAANIADRQTQSGKRT